jgi:hypothetical protein
MTSAPRPPSASDSAASHSFASAPPPRGHTSITHPPLCVALKAHPILQPTQRAPVAWLIAAIAPAAVTAARPAGEPAVPMTLMPAAAASWTTARPTAPLAPRTYAARESIDERKPEITHARAMWKHEIRHMP